MGTTSRELWPQTLEDLIKMTLLSIFSFRCFLHLCHFWKCQVLPWRRHSNLTIRRLHLLLNLPDFQTLEERLRIGPDGVISPQLSKMSPRALPLLQCPPEVTQGEGSSISSGMYLNTKTSSWGSEGGRECRAGGKMQRLGHGEGEARTVNAQEACVMCPFQGSAAVTWFVPFTERGIGGRIGELEGARRLKKMAWLKIPS